MAKNFMYPISVLLFIGLCSFANPSNVRQNVQKTFHSQIGIREKTGKNDGVEVEKYLKSVGLGKGNPWCAAFVFWCLNGNGVKCPKSGYSPSWFASTSLIYKRGGSENYNPLPGDVFGIYFPEKNRIAHVGFIEKWDDKIVITVEGNTNDAGSREGDGVYKKRRIKRQIYAVSRYIHL